MRRIDRNGERGRRREQVSAHAENRSRLVMSRVRMHTCFQEAIGESAAAAKEGAALPDAWEAVEASST